MIKKLSSHDRLCEASHNLSFDGKLLSNDAQEDKNFDAGL